MHEYPVVVGRALLDEVHKHLPGVKKVLVVHPQALTSSAEQLKENLDGYQFEVLLAGIPDGDDSKRVEVASFAWQIMGQADFNRNDAVIGLGGGATTDMAGFIASTWLRGVRYIAIPTTLLAMVDAAIGGKTGLNTSEGKNLVGTFYLPSAVIADIDTLKTLPKHDLTAGFAEIVKYGFVYDPAILDVIEANLDSVTDPDSELLEELINKSISIKRKVTESDFRESGEREFLNYGHTLGHAIENVERYQWRHGAAISIGMVYAAELSLSKGHLSTDQVDRHRSIFTSLGLPVSYRGDRWPQLFDALKKDKKVRGGILRFVTLQDFGKPEITSSLTEEELFATYQSIID
jgi:3-dehydroquinate synthase